MIPINQQQKLTNGLLILLGAIFLCLGGIYNGYPFCFSDSGTYIGSGFENFIPFDRPIFYGWFVRHMSLRESFWLVILVQGIIISSLIFSFIKIWIRKPYLVFGIVICSLTFLTGLSFHVSVLMPDIFSGALILAVLILVFANELSIFKKLWFYFIITFSVLVHNSNLMLIVGIAALIAIYGFYRKKYFFYSLWLSIALAISILTTLTTSFIIDNKIQYAKGSNVFLMSRIIELNLMADFLADYCPEKNYAFCAQLDSIPGHIPGYFLWHPNSPLYQTGGWEVNNKAYAPLVKDFFTSKHVKGYLMESLKSSSRLMYQFDVLPWTDDSPRWHIQKFLPEEIDRHNQSRQSTNPIDFLLLNTIQKYFVLISFLFLLLLLFLKKKVSVRKRTVIFTLFISITLNAVICATLSDVSTRYQGRIIWLIPMLAILFAFDLARKNELFKNPRTSP